MIGQLRQSFCLGYANTNREVRPAQNRLANFPAKVGKVATVTNSCQIAKCLIDTVNFAARRELFQRGHHTIGHIGIELIVATKRDNAVPAKHVLLFEVRLPHFDKGLRLSGTSNHTTVGIGKDDYWPPFQVRTKHRLTRCVKGVHIAKRKHLSQPI